MMTEWKLSMDGRVELCIVIWPGEVVNLGPGLGTGTGPNLGKGTGPKLDLGGS